MTEVNKQGIDIGMEYLKGIYTNADMETKEVQPIYILQRDTIRTFLHESLEKFGLSSRLLGYFGIEITLFISLFTASFNDWLGLKGNDIKGTFVAFTIIIGIIIIKNCFIWYKNFNKLSVDELAKELGSRGTIIKSGKKEDGN
jgi:hypothetical protein